MLTDTPAPGTFEAMFRALDQASRPIIGPATARLLVIPLHDDAGCVAGGLWARTQMRWLHIELLVVPEPVRRRGIGSILVTTAEREARARGCIGANVNALSFQAVGFYQRLGFTPFGVLDNFPPGHQQVYFQKRFDQP